MNQKRVVLGGLALLFLLLVCIICANYFTGPDRAASTTVGDSTTRQSSKITPEASPPAAEPAAKVSKNEVKGGVKPPAAESDNAEGAGTLARNLWQDINEESLKGEQAERQIKPKAYRTVKIDKSGMEDLLAKTPMEVSGQGVNSKMVMILPMPDGTLSRYRIEESPIMAPELAAKFPELKTYHGQGIDDPTATIRFDLTPKGFHAMVIAAAYTVYIDPYAKGDTQNYISYFKHDVSGNHDWRCNNLGDNEAVAMRAKSPALAQRTNGATLRTFRLAISCTVEYTAYQGGTVAKAMAGVVTTMNRVNGIYEREVAVHMNLIANENLLINTVEPDGFTNGSPDTMIDENQTKIDTVIGDANYDIGHVFGTDSGGLAQIACVGQSTLKAQGVTGSSAPSGDSFDVDYVAHEMGHQFGGHHSFNDGSSGSCGGGTRTGSAAYEPGSGSTIMCYAGICDTADLQPHSNDYFHFKGLDEIVANLATIPTVGTSTPTNNTPPTANAGANFTIPASTPFILTATGADADNDAITYCWEEYDLGSASPPEADNGNRPIFRSFNPTTSPSRTFPQLSDVLSASATFGELLPSTSRTMTFKLTVRDNRAGGGGIQDSSTQVTVASTAGPFAVTAPNTSVTFPGSSQQTITWSVNNTDKAPVSTANVNILMSTDGGNTFPIVLASNTANDGTETVTIPNVVTTNGRIKVEAVNNIFFDISDADFTVTVDPNAPTVVTVTPNTGPATGGTAVTIAGSNFAAGATVKFGTSAATNVVVVSPASITCVTPAGTAGTVGVSVISGGSTGLLPNGFSYQNPVPVLASISPQSGSIGGNAFTMTLNGTNFAAGATVKWPGKADLATTSNTPTMLTVTVPASYLAVGGGVNVAVFNPAPGGGTSSPVTFGITSAPNPVPTLTSISPSVITPGGPAITLTLTGTNFVPFSTVKFAGQADLTPSTVTGGTQITVTVPASYIAAEGTPAISAFNPGPGGGSSNAATLTIITASPVPALTSITPASVSAGTASFSMTLAGTGFSSLAVVKWPGQADLTPANTQTATQLSVIVPAAYFATVGTSSITVFNPAPGGGTSGAQVFTATPQPGVSPPVVSSPLASGGNVGSGFNYTVAADGAQPISLSATGLPPGLIVSGNSISGAPTASGIYLVTLTIANSGGTDIRTLYFDIGGAGDPIPNISESLIDGDQDGFPDEIEKELGTNPANSTDNPFGSTKKVVSEDLDFSKLKIALNFSTNKDSIGFDARFPVDAGLVLLGQKLTLDVGGVIQTFTLDKRGGGKAGLSKVTSTKPKNGIATFHIKLAGALSSKLTDEGMTKEAGDNGDVDVPILAIFNGHLYQAVPTLFYSTNGKTGKAVP